MTAVFVNPFPVASPETSNPSLVLPAPPRLSGLRWLMIGLAFLATVINYLDRQTLSVVAPELKKQFAMTDETYGLILSAFMLAYTVMNGISGPLLDRVGTRVGYAFSMAPASAACYSVGFPAG